MATIALGKDIDSWCMRCKLVLAHTVETIVDGKVKRVHCNTCGAQHMYRATAPGESSAGTRPRARGASSTARAVPAATIYAGLMQGRNPASARAYAMTQRFKAGDLLQHPSFGVGVVTADKGDGKVEVVFESGGKVLVHGRS